MPKDNLLFKLDNLEYQYHYANGDVANFRPRLGNTAKLYNAKGKKSSKKISKLLSELNLDLVTEQLNALRLQIFNNKVYHLEKNLKSLLLKSLTSYRPKKNAKNDFTPLIEKIKQNYGLEKFCELVCKSKVIKISVAKVVRSKKSPVPNWFEAHSFWRIYNDKSDEFNPSRVWAEVLLPNKFDQLISTFMNNDKCRALLSTFDSGMNLFLGINKEVKDSSSVNRSDQDAEGATHAKQTKSEDIKGDISSPDEGDDHEEVPEFDEGLLKQYDGMLGDSDEEDKEDSIGTAALNPEVNYNEVTDEEPDLEDIEDDSRIEEDSSDSDDELGETKPTVQLPELMAGYYSGEDSDDSVSPADDKVARRQISTKEKKKNRRGQRARRKIWEKKYGRQAKHIQREVEKEHQDRKRRQEEYEERVAKRAAKVITLGADNAQTTQQNEVKPVERVKTEHPSWVAKRVAEEKLKNSKFQGKKITFD